MNEAKLDAIVARLDAANDLSYKDKLKKAMDILDPLQTKVYAYREGTPEHKKAVEKYEKRHRELETEFGIKI